jgi:hypothetical protein
LRFGRWLICRNLAGIEVRPTLLSTSVLAALRLGRKTSLNPTRWGIWSIWKNWTGINAIRSTGLALCHRSAISRTLRSPDCSTAGRPRGILSGRVFFRANRARIAPIPPPNKVTVISIFCFVRRPTIRPHFSSDLKTKYAFGFCVQFGIKTSARMSAETSANRVVSA